MRRTTMKIQHPELVALVARSRVASQRLLTATGVLKVSGPLVLNNIWRQVAPAYIGYIVALQEAASVAAEVAAKYLTVLAEAPVPASAPALEDISSAQLATYTHFAKKSTVN
jgi:hypothetical protein